MKQKYLITGLMVAIFAGGITCHILAFMKTMDTCVTESPICPLT